MLKRGIGMDNRSTGEKFQQDWCSQNFASISPEN